MREALNEGALGNFGTLSIILTLHARHLLTPPRKTRCGVGGAAAGDHLIEPLPDKVFLRHLADRLAAGGAAPQSGDGLTDQTL